MTETRAGAMGGRLASGTEISEQQSERCTPRKIEWLTEVPPDKLIHFLLAEEFKRFLRVDIVIVDGWLPVTLLSVNLTNRVCVVLVAKQVGKVADKEIVITGQGILAKVEFGLGLSSGKLVIRDGPGLGVELSVCVTDVSEKTRKKVLRKKMWPTLELSRDEEEVRRNNRAIRSYGASGEEEGAKVFSGGRHGVRVVR